MTIHAPQAHSECAHARPDFSLERLCGRWRALAEHFFNADDGRRLIAQINASAGNVFPPTPFKALELTPYEAVRVVVIGQDPYHTPGKAEGLAFSVGNGEALPPSLKNIFKELAWEEACCAPVRTTGSLVDWARQGVLLLNTILTVEEGRPLSHAGIGWETFTTEIIQTLSDSGRHSPFSASRGPDAFMLSRTFTRANDWLAAHGETPIDWRGPVLPAELKRRTAQTAPKRKKESGAPGDAADSQAEIASAEVQPSLF